MLIKSMFKQKRENSLFQEKKSRKTQNNVSKKQYHSSQKRWSEKIENQEEILFDALDLDYATPNLQLSEEKKDSTFDK